MEEDEDACSFDIGREIDLFLDGPCNAERWKECRKNSGEMIELLCESCRRREYNPSPYTVNLYRVFTLQRAGFPLRAEDLDFDFWMDLSLFRLKFEAKRFLCPWAIQG